MTKRLRLGIDVGGTFTDVVAVEAQTREIVASVKVPTTHDAPEGVAAGIVAGIAQLLERGAIDPQEVVFIAHSTTQATNALLEGDVADVAVVGLLDALAPLARAQMRFPAIDLAPGARFAPRFAFARPGQDRERVDELVAAGSPAVAVSQAFAVDRPRRETALVDYARRCGLFATAGHEVSSMYGLRARTRTAAINAAMLPKMVHTARMTDASVREARICAPLMIMRSDGGVMDLREVERRPILTLLSGPAAGVAGALLHENVTDGIFIEVGGTSSDASAIRAGMPQMRPARVGGHRTMLRTLDVRTLAVAGGSMVRIGAGEISGVGPRSAHIAGARYASFVDPALLEGAVVERIRPTSRDTADYVVLRGRDGTPIALTPTCAANLLGYVPEDAFARGNVESVRRAFNILADHLHGDPRALAQQLLEIASAKVLEAIDTLVLDYALDRQSLVVIGGGGGAAALVPFAARRSGLDFRLARDAEVISPIGVALALVRETVERTIADPSPGDIARVRRQAQDAAIASGAAPERVEVTVEIDTQRNLVRASASGATAMAQSSSNGERSDHERRAIAARLLRVEPGELRELQGTSALSIYERERSTTGCFGRVQRTRDVRVLDMTGVARLGLREAVVTRTTASRAEQSVREAIEKATDFGDVGRALPEVYLLHGARVANLSGLANAQQVAALAREELAGREPDAPVVILTAHRRPEQAPA